MIIAIYAILLCIILLLAEVGRIRIPRTRIITAAFWGGMFGSIMYLTVVLAVQIIMRTPIRQSDIWSYPFFIIPVGGLLGGLAGTAFVANSRGAVGQMIRTLLFGTLSVSIYFGPPLYEVSFNIGHPISGSENRPFWLAVYSFPVLFILLLWVVLSIAYLKATRS